MDIKLPDLDGYDVLTRLKPMAGLEKTLFIALTGYGPEEIEKNGHGVSFDLVLRKPVDTAYLEAVISAKI